MNNYLIFNKISHIAHKLDQLGTPHLTRLWIVGRLLFKTRNKKNLDLRRVFQRLNALPCKKVYYVSSTYIQPLTTHWIHQYMNFQCRERGRYRRPKHYLIFPSIRLLRPHSTLWSCCIQPWWYCTSCKKLIRLCCCLSST